MAPAKVMRLAGPFVPPPPTPVTAADVARPRSRWELLETFYQDGLAFDVLVNWDGRARIEQNGKIVLAFWYPAGNVLRAIDRRRMGEVRCANVVRGPW